MTMIKAVVIIHWGMIAVFLIFLITQVLVPAARGRPLFPILRRRNRRAEGMLAAARERDDVKQAHADLEEIIERGHRRLREKSSDQPNQNTGG